MRGKLVVGNWKMHGGLKQNDALLADLRAGWTAPVGRGLAVCVPFPYLWQAQAALSGSAIAWGVQNMSEHASGAFTGEVSAAMAAEFGCTYAIVGHSERRVLFKESDATVAAKASAAMQAGLTPIVCVGETLAEREAGSTGAVVTRQLEPVLASLGDRIIRAVLAYEPVWAIGTGRNASPEQAQEVHHLLRQRLGVENSAVPLLYGGSVKAPNARSLFQMPDIDGGLIGGASLKADEFLAIANA
ncbi:MAG TPA: triose-phosphate isomerase [Casimicrobiaceae bacterium]|nr:triose-phosphate isomerase [Casimicrobiaceae bacterium]